MALMEALDQDEIECFVRIADYMKPVVASLLRATCETLARIIPIRGEIYTFVCYAWQYGHHELRDIARECLGTRPLSYASFNKMIIDAAKNGYRDVCVVLRERAIASGKNPHFNGMLINAAQHGHRELCELAREWGMESSTPLNFNGMIIGAAKGGHRELCELAREWGATDFNEMLISAAQHGHRELCVLAREWLDACDIKPDVDNMLYAAEFADHVRARDICELAREWGATDFSIMLVSAAAGGHRDLCVLAYEWIGACPTSPKPLDLNHMVTIAIVSGHPYICKLAHEWNARNRETTLIDYDQMLCLAEDHSDDLVYHARKWRAEFNAYLDTVLIDGAKCQDPIRGQDICISARLRGATNYRGMLIIAIRRGNRDLCDLARKWITGHLKFSKPRSTASDPSGSASPSPIDFSEMLNIAAECGHRDICIFVRDWAREWHFASGGSKSSKMAGLASSLDFNGMLEHAARGGHRDICILAREWAQSGHARSKPSLDFNLMLIGATYGNHRDLCELALEWLDEASISPNVECMLACAAERGHRDLCILAREWGAKTFDLMLEYAISGGHQKTCNLARKWIGESK